MEPHDAGDAGAAVTPARTQHRSAPAPEYVLRGHEAQINTLSFVHPGNLLLSGDADGYVGVWSMESFRPLLYAKLHNASVLTVASWASGSRMLTHGRDNKVQVYDLRSISTFPTQSSVTGPCEAPAPLHSIDTNALGYCKCDVLEISSSEALIAVPSTLDDNLADIFHFPSCKRRHRSIGKGAFESKTGTIMALSMVQRADDLDLIIAYESGKVAVFRHAESLQHKESVWLEEGNGWQLISESHQHKEPIMGLCIDACHNTAWTVSADHLVVRYNLSDKPDMTARAFKTAYPGRGAIAVRDDGRILATAGWDGALRIHSAASFKPLAVMTYHRDSLYAVTFQCSAAEYSASTQDEKHTGPHKNEVARRWLAAAGADQRISLWDVYPGISALSQPA